MFSNFDIAIMANAYIAAAIFSSEGDPPTDEERAAEVSASARRDAVKDCTDFCNKNAPLIEEAVTRPGYTWDRLGIDFWFTRNGHGTGFWDRNELRAGGLGGKLSDGCRQREVDLYVGDDGRWYFASVGAFA